ncbi:hypothetical protein [Bartonella sp. HY038]|uniref:hypothetical protein n=1 Tax=Bartonella sp. HY038 TaxID=2759660 RepID=UPI0015F8EEF7|nr:hypothetical protein [Bartonella sp. HY038]
MQKSYYSIWLRPISVDFTSLSDSIAHFSQLFNSENFEPHMTLAGDISVDIEKGEASLIALMEAIAKDISIFSAPIIDVRQEDVFFRSFYLAFDLVENLAALKQRAADYLKTDDFDSFMPHLSLAYGVEDSLLKRQEIEKIQKIFAGKSMAFDQLVLSTASSHNAIKNWRVKHVLPLKPITA